MRYPLCHVKMSFGRDPKTLLVPYVWGSFHQDKALLRKIHC